MSTSAFQLCGGLLLTCLYVAAPLTCATLCKQSNRALLAAAAWCLVAAITAPLLFR